MAASFREIPAELHESITTLLGTRDVILLDAQLRIKSKVENIVLVLMPWRALVVLAKLPVKNCRDGRDLNLQETVLTTYARKDYMKAFSMLVQVSFSFLAVQTIRIGGDNQVVVETDSSSCEFEFLSLDDLEHMVIHMVTSLKRIFPNSSPGNLLQNASPILLDRMKAITDSLEELLKENPGPCGGFSEIYAALCDYSGFPFQEEIQWDVDNIYHNQECREFNLLDFNHLHSQDVALSVTALSLNQWFTRLYCKDFKLNLDILDQILHVLSKSVTLEELVLENCGLKFDFAQRMAQVLRNHPNNTLNTLNLSGNLLEDRGIIALSQNLEQSIKGFQSLNFARTSLTPKGMLGLCQSLGSNSLFRTTLYHLDLSGNPGSLATEGADGLFSFLSQPNALGHLDLSGTGCALDMLFDALASGCCERLIHLNLSKNIYTHRKNSDVPVGISDFFSKASALQHVSLAGTKLPTEALRALLQALAYNSQLTGLHLDLSSCELKSAGAQVIQDLISDASSIKELNLSNNGFDSDMVTLVLAISRSSSIKHIALGKNFNIRSRETLADALHRLVQLTQDDDCSVKSLSVAESHLKLGASIILDGLRSRNSCLIMLDISGNAMGDVGAKILAKALSVNTTLRTLIWDRNNTTLCGFLDVTRALLRNFTLNAMPLPITDVAQAHRSHPEKMEEVVHKIQSYLARNQIQRSLPKERCRLQPDSIASSSAQALKDAYQSVHKCIEMLSSVQDVEVKADILWAEEIIKDASLSISVLPGLYELESPLPQNSRVQHKLESLIEELSQTCSSNVQHQKYCKDICKALKEDDLEALARNGLYSTTIMHASLVATQSLCPKLMKKNDFQDHLISSVPKKTLHDQFVTKMYSRLMEIQQSVTEAMVNGIADKILEELATVQGKLVRHLSKLAQEPQVMNAADCNTFQQGHRSLWDVVEKDFQNEEHMMAAQWKHSCSTSILPTSGLNGLSELDFKVEAEDNKIGAPQAALSLSRASVKSRPASTKDAEAGSRQLPCTEPPSAQSLMDLPTAGEKLEHYTRDRPRPNRRNRKPPSKPNVQPPVRENDEDRSIARLDEGLDEFFTKKVIHEHLQPTSLDSCLAAATPTPSGSRALKKKIGHFFAFKKPKSSRGSRPEKEPEGSPSATRGRKLMLSDILRAPSKASEPTKALSKSEEGGLSSESRGYLEQSQTPDSARRVRTKYSREGKSQSLILLSGEDEEGLVVRHEKKRPFEKSDGELPSSFEQRVHVMLHRIGVTKVLSSEGKKKQSKDGEIKKAGSDGDIVDSSAESPPCSLKSRTHSMSTDPSMRLGPADAAGRTGTEPSGGFSEGRLSWKALGKQLNVELKGKCSELSSSPRRVFAIQEPASPREQKSKESWSSSLPRIGRSTAGPLPTRRTSNAGEGRAFPELQNSYADVNVIAGDNQLKPKSRLKPVTNRRAMSVHEEQLRDQACAAELHHAKLPLCLQRSPIVKWKIKPKSLLEPETSTPSDSPSTPHQGRKKEPTEAKPKAEMEEELQQALEQTLENAQNTALDQRTAVPLSKSPTQEH